MGLLLAAANLFFRDVKYVVEIILMFGIFFVPVFFDSHMFGKWEPFLLANPMSGILEAFNSVVVLHQQPEMFWFGYAGVCSVLICIVSVFIFRKTEPLFAENI